MGKTIQLTVTIDTETLSSELNGPVKSPPAMAWLLFEAQRLWMLELNKQQERASERRIHIPELHIGKPGAG